MTAHDKFRKLSQGFLKVRSSLHVTSLHACPAVGVRFKGICTVRENIANSINCIPEGKPLSWCILLWDWFGHLRQKGIRNFTTKLKVPIFFV